MISKIGEFKRFYMNNIKECKMGTDYNEKLVEVFRMILEGDEYGTFAAKAKLFDLSIDDLARIKSAASDVIEMANDSISLKKRMTF